MLILGLLTSGMASAAAESISLDHPVPLAGDDFFLNISTNGTCIAMIFITNSTGYAVWNGIVSITGNNSQIGPFNLGEGTYTVNSTFLYPSGGSNELTSAGLMFSVGPEAEEEDEYSAMYVLLVGMGVVFFVLAILAMITFIAGKYLPKDAKPAPQAPVVMGNENERIAAIAAIMKNRRA